MKTFSRLQFIKMLLLLFVGFTMTACRDSNDDIPSDDDTKEVTQIYQKLQRQTLLKSLCTVDTLADGTIAYTSRYGAVLDETKPTVHYVGINNISEAHAAWNGIVSVFNESESDTFEGNKVHLNDMKLSFSISENEEEMARIEVDCPELSNSLTSIVFIPNERWPENDIGSPFLFMSFWKNKKTGLLYLCVNKAQGSRGIMLTLGGGCEEDKFRKYTHWQGEFTLWMNTADEQAFNCLANIMQCYPSRYALALEKIGTITREFVLFGKQFTYYPYRYTLFHELFNLSGDSSITFDRGHDWDYHLWRAYRCYDVTVYRTTFYPDRTCSHWRQFYTHKNTPVPTEGSHCFYFDQSFKVNPEEWECIFRGLS
ncbi:hypothetical protein [Bacteroides zoogleoformans]|uniref:hypothetical protein n=1 Tax=Bacteroides zoogleoformans TaxID=28119 RepID=UPI00248E6B71|nr:hypothetical protein [Bacteroides zoogleoformans]